MVLVQLENRRVILGSSSIRRKELLSMILPKFDIICPDCDETLDKNLSLENAIIDVSKRKASSIITSDPLDIIITADTLVALGTEVLSKPKDEQDAFNMLSKLSANTHEVLTAVSIKTNNKITSFCITTKVIFNEISSDEILNYIKTKEPLDKAGSYGIQGLGGVFVHEIHGDYYSVVGLPISTLYTHLKNI